MSSHNFVPINLTEEKKKFFFDPNYNPQFIFSEPISDETIYGMYGHFGNEFFELAKAKIDSVIKEWGSETAYLEAVGGKILTKEQTVIIIQDYLKKCNLQDTVKLRFSPLFITRTRIDEYTMNIRLPITYREKSILGMLHHEIGTHVFRRINDEFQMWHDKRNQFKMRSYLETEEGIALIHGNIESEESYLWFACLHYFARSLASTMSFSQVFENLKSYIDDRNERWNVTLRAKRGLRDTSQIGGFTKDQVYLRGIMKVSSWLKENDYDMARLYIGKVALEDLSKVEQLAKEDGLRLPYFMTEDPKAYRTKVKQLMKDYAL